MSEFFKKYKIEFIIFSLALLVRVVFFFVALNANGWDITATIHGQDFYYEVSNNLVLGNGFSMRSAPPYDLYDYGAPLYPYFLTLIKYITGSYLVASIIQIIIGAIIPLMGMKLTRMLIPSLSRAPFIVGLLLALEPYHIVFSHGFYTETFFIAIFLIFLILFFKFLDTPSFALAFGTGLFLGLSALTKPTVQYVPILIVFYTFWVFRKSLDKKILFGIATICVVFVFTISTWVYRNYRDFGVFALTTQVSFNLKQKFLPSILSIEKNITFSQAEGLLVNYPEKISYKELTEYPIAILKLGVLSGLTFFTHDGMLTFEGTMGVFPDVFLQKPAYLILVQSPVNFLKIISHYIMTPMVLILVMRVFWILVFLFFIYGTYSLLKSKNISNNFIFAIIIVIYFMLTTMINGLSVNARFRMPVESIILAVSYAGVISFSQNIKKKPLVYQTQII